MGEKLFTVMLRCAPRAARALATAALLGAFSIPIRVEDGPEACEPRRHTSHMASDTTRGTGLLGAPPYATVAQRCLP